MTDDSPHLQTRPKYTNLPHCKVATSMQTCPKYILAPPFRVMHYEWAAWKKEVCFSNQFKLLNFSALHVLPCEPCSVTWREGSAIDRRAGPQTTEDMLSESPRCNDMVADLHFPRDTKGRKVSGNFGNFPWKVSGILKGWEFSEILGIFNFDLFSTFYEIVCTKIDRTEFTLQYIRTHLFCTTF